MNKAHATLGLLSPRCELCGTPAPPRHGDAHRGGFIDLDVSTNDRDGSQTFWACEACVPRQQAFVRHSLTPSQAKTLVTVRGEQGNVVDWKVHGHQRPEASTEHAACLGREELAAWHLLCSVRGVGPMAAAAIHAAGQTPADVIQDPTLFPLEGKRAAGIISAIRALTEVEQANSLEFAESQLLRAREVGASIISYNNADYPPLVLNSKNPIPILWIRGNRSILRSRSTVACVGSRGIRSPYSELQGSFAEVAVEEGFAIVSGFAMGADSIGHQRALDAGGSTVCVMPCGTDRVFPPENRTLWSKLLDSNRAVFVSEFEFGHRAESLTLRKRNKLIVAAAQGVLVGQSSRSGGAMNAFRFGLEQKKPIATFDHDGTEETSGNEEIKSGTKGNTFAFPVAPAIEDYRRWLREL